MNTNKFQKALLYLLILAALSFIPTLFFTYVNEEAILTISSLEMHYHHAYLMPTFMGIDYWRPPLFNWLIIIMANLLGWPHALIGQRLIAASSTLLSTLILIRLSKKLTQRTDLAYLIGLVYLTGDALFYTGWIATADPLFSLFCFGSIAAIWLSILDNKVSYFYLASLLVIAAYLTKALTVYYLYASSLAILAWHYKNQVKQILSIHHLIALILVLAFPIFWSHYTQSQTQGQNMLWDINHQLNFPLTLATLWSLSSFLLQYIFKFPMSLLFFYYLANKRFKDYKNFEYQKLAILALIIALVNFFPYWIFPERHEIRYTMPTYPLIAMFLGIFLWNLHQQKPILIAASIFIIAKFAFCLGFYLNQHHLFGQYQQTANTILTDTHGQKLYYQDGTSTGQSELAYLDLTIYPEAPLIATTPATGPYFLVKFPPQDRTDESNPYQGLFKVYNVGHSTQHIYLYKIN